MCDTYNGWENYQTWVFNLWFDDYFAEDAVEFYHQAASDYHNDGIDQITNNATYMLSQYIEDFAEEWNPIEDDANVWADLMGHAIGMINFYEIAGHYIDEVAEEEG